MDKRSLTLDEFIAEYPFWGEWKVSYTDGTHLETCEYVKLGKIIIDASKEIAQEYPILPFTFKSASSKEIDKCFSQLIECRLSKISKEKARKKQAKTLKTQANRAKEIIRDQLADSMVRTGLLRPDFCLMEEQIAERRFLEIMKQLSKPGHLTFVVDTGALRRAVPSFLNKTLSNIPIWTVVPVLVMAEIQQQIYDLNEIWRNSNAGTQPHLGKCDVLRKRPQVSCTSRELNHIRQWRPLEILKSIPEHADQFNIDSKNDRLIIESMKDFKQNRGIQKGVYLLTGDKDMASLATLENQGILHIGVPRMATETSSVRYDSYNRKWLLTPVHYLLWDLAQVFSTIRLVNKELSRTYKLVYYSQSRDGFLARDIMEIHG